MNKKLFVTIAVIAIGISSCKKDDNTNNGNNNNNINYGTSVEPIKEMLTFSIYNSPYLQTDAAVTRANSFKSSIDGRVTHLGARLTKGTYTVSLWDSSAQSILKTANVTVIDSTQFTYTDIDDVNIVKDKTYIIAVNTLPIGATQANKYWVYLIINSSDDFPKTKGNITVLNNLTKYTSDRTSLFPADFVAKEAIAGIGGFKFEPKQ